METDIPKTVIVELSALVVLAGYLCVSVCLRSREAWRRRREDLARTREFRKHWRPTALDASLIQRQIESVRRDYSVAVHHHARRAEHYSRLIGLVRKAISQLSYFGPAKNRSEDLNEHER